MKKLCELKIQELIIVIEIDSPSIVKVSIRDASHLLDFAHIFMFMIHIMSKLNIIWLK